MEAQMKKEHSSQDGNTGFLSVPVGGTHKIPGKEAEVLGLPGNQHQ